MASLEVDLSKIEPGSTITVKWRGKPVFIKRRTEEDIELANKVDLKTLRDPQEDKDRVQNPEVGIQCDMQPAVPCSQIFVASFTSAVICSGWWSSGFAHIWAASHCPMPGTTMAGSAHATEAIMTPQAELARDPRPTTWRCQSTASLMITPSRSDEQCAAAVYPLVASACEDSQLW